jgi:hypothetical protein
MEEMRNAYRNVFEKPRGKRNLEDIVVDGRILKKQHMTVWLGFIWHCCEHSNKPSYSINCAEFL